MHFHIFVTSAITVLERITTLWTEIAFDVNAVMLLDFRTQLVRYEMQRLLVHRTVFYGVNFPSLSLGPIFKATLEHVDDRRLASAYRPHEQQDTLADFESLRRGFEIFDNPCYGFFDAEELAGEELVG